MNRDDSILFTGMHSVSARRVAQNRQERIKDKKEQQVVLQPDAHLIIDIIEKDRAEVPKLLWELVRLNDDENTVKAAQLAIRMYDDYLSKLKTKVTNVLREPITTKKSEAKDGEE